MSDRTYRTRIARYLIATVALLAAMMLVAAPALADECDGEGNIFDGGGEVVGECADSSPGKPGTRSEETVWNRYCRELLGAYRSGDEVEFRLFGPLTPEEVEDYGLDPSGDYVWYEVFCWRDGLVDGDYPIIVETSTPPLSPEEVRDLVAVRLEPPTPTPATSPRLGSQTVVQMPTWLWLDAGDWRPIEGSRTVGTVSVRVRATPKTALWLMGDGATVSCAGPGTPWVQGLDPSASDCSHTYLDSSYGLPRGRFDASVSVQWEYEWWLNGAYQGAFGSLDVSTAFEVAVGEIQGIKTTEG